MLSQNKWGVLAILGKATPNEYQDRWIRAHPNKGLPLFSWKKGRTPLSILFPEKNYYRWHPVFNLGLRDLRNNNTVEPGN